jgi:Tol biopolymer transport system component
LKMAAGQLADERLDSWKNIAAYLGRDVRTLIRWEKNKGLPVRRVPGGQRQTVFAYKHELDEWLKRGSLAATRQTPDVTGVEIQLLPGPPTRRQLSLRTRGRVPKLLLVTALAFFVFVAGVALLLVRATVPKLEITALTQLTHDGVYKSDLLTDGNQLYFSEQMNGGTVLSAMPVTGGEIRSIKTPFARVEVFDISADGKNLLAVGHEGIEAEKALWVVPLNGRMPWRVGSVSCHFATWSPDGHSIAYATGNNIYLTTADGASPRRLTSFRSIPWMLRWSPDGKNLRVELEDSTSEKTSLWNLTFDDHFAVSSSTPLQLPLDGCCSGWSEPAGSNFSFFAWGGTGDNSIWALPKENHQKAVRLTTKLGLIEGLAASSKPGRLFLISKIGSREELLRFDHRSAHFVPYLPDLSVVYVDFSRDGVWITYTRLPDETLWVSRTDGSAARQLTLAPIRVQLPRWSPDGRQIAFMAKQPDKPWRIYLISPAGGAAREVAHGSDSQGAPTWSHDGRFLAYGNVNCQEARTCGIQTIDLLTRRVERLPGSEGMRTARWSPDGRYIAAMEPEQQQLLVFDVRKRIWRKLADAARGDDLSWSRDSSYVYTAQPSGDNPKIIRVSLLKGKVENVVDLASFGRSAGAFSPWFCLAPDDSVIALRRLDASEIYALNWIEK